MVLGIACPIPIHLAKRVRACQTHKYRNMPQYQANKTPWNNDALLADLRLKVDDQDAFRMSFFYSFSMFC